MSSILVALGVIIGCVVGEWVEPWFCHGLNCPPYTNPQNITVDGKSIEIRQYIESVWAATLIENVDLKTAEDEGFNTIFQYISGANVDNQEIPMTTPVRTYIEPSQGPCNSLNTYIYIYITYLY